MSDGSDVDAGSPRGLPLAALVWIAPVAWFVHLSAGMVLGPASCRWGSELPLHLLSIAALVVALGGAWLLLRRDAADPAARFVVRMGLGFAAISSLAIVVVALAVMPLDGCEL